MNITECLPGDRIKLVDFGKTNGQFRQRLLALGITRGVTVSVERIAPFGCPVQIAVRGTALALRKDEACYLVWERC